MITIDNFKIGSGKTFLVAELSANHNQDFQLAVDTIKAIKKSGADAVKLQTFTADSLTINCNKKHFQIGGGTLWDGKTLYDLYKEAQMPLEWNQKLFNVAKEEGLICFSSPLDFETVDLLESINTPAYKIPSFEITDLELIKHAASKQKPIILSTGIAEKDDIHLAIDACRKVGNNQIVLLKCTSSYPAPLEIANLKTISDYKNEFGVEVGFSDHTKGIVAPIVATTFGATMIEKHFILDKKNGGLDADFSLEPHEFLEMSKAVRDAEKLIGTINYNLPEKVKQNKVFARSIFVTNDIKSGETFSNKNIRVIRPGYGMHPKYLNAILGKKAKFDIERGTPLSNEMIEE
ncbi:MAG: pseudaminic acid synthase [Bacteroidales bacterium]|nr:pseudaminic acid synthase [Bacteroidales bacterium]